MTNPNNRMMRSFGTSRTDRALHALDPASAPIDERSPQELLTLATRFAELLQYYNEHDEPVGDWTPFLVNDISSYLAQVLSYRLEGRFSVLSTTFKAARIALELSEKEEGLKQVISSLVELVSMMNDWYVKASNLEVSGQDHSLQQILAKAIKEELASQWALLQSVIDASNTDPQIRLNYVLDDTTLLAFHRDWRLQETHEEFSFLDEESAKEKVNYALTTLNGIFEKLSTTLSFVHVQAQYLFEQSLTSNDNHQPDIGLLLSFIDLFGYAQDYLNDLTQKHLNHYYLNVLKQTIQPAEPDSTIVRFELADHVQSHLIDKGTLLLAGINQDGIESHYATQQALLVSSAKIASLRTIFVSRNQLIGVGSSYSLISNIYKAEVANSGDGMGGVFLGKDKSWPIFGEEQLDKSTDERRMQNASVGFAITSPVLRLEEGEREVVLQFKMTPPSLALFQDLIEDISQNENIPIDTVFYRLFGKAIKVYGTTTEGWFLIEKYLVSPPSDWKRGSIDLNLKLSINDCPLLATEAPLEYDYQSRWPLLKVIISAGESIYNYSFLKDLEVETITITAEVKGLKSLTLINENGLLDNSAPFFPFGPIPTKNSYLLIGNIELFTKPITAVTFNLEWNNLPEEEGGFRTYFEEYMGDDGSLETGDFQCQLSALSNYQFLPTEKPKRQTFCLFSSVEETGELQSFSQISKLDFETLALQADYQMVELPEYNNKIRSGYFRLQLSNPPMLFGHKAYPRLFARTMMSNAQIRPGKGEPKDPPREPFSPMLEKVTIDYKASSVINLKDLEGWTNSLEQDERIYKIHPFGTEVIFKDGKAQDQFLLPQLEEDGYLFIGLEGLSPGQPLSFYFTIKESKAPLSKSIKELRWSYLNRNKWYYFEPGQVLADMTEGFTTSGLVILDIPIDISTGNSLLPAEYHWICISVTGGLENIGRMEKVHLHAVPVSWVDNGDPQHYQSGIDLPRIQELIHPHAAIGGVHQIEAFQMLKSPERTIDFYTRVSERLRHKGRAIAAWDIEHLVLQEFPSVQQVKCIGAASYPAYVNAGSVVVVVIPRTDGEEAEPTLGFHVLQQIKEYLEELMSPFVTLEVINPVYEKLKITCSILLEAGLEQERGSLLQQLQLELLHFLCPWTKGRPVALGSQVSKNDILRFIRDRPYIRFVTAFSIVHVYEQTNDQFTLEDTAKSGTSLDRIWASKPWSALVPVEQHQVSFLKRDFYARAEVTAIDSMRLGTDFIVLEEKDDSDTVEVMGTQPSTSIDDDDWYITF